MGFWRRLPRRRRLFYTTLVTVSSPGLLVYGAYKYERSKLSASSQTTVPTASSPTPSPPSSSSSSAAFSIRNELDGVQTFMYRWLLHPSRFMTFDSILQRTILTRVTRALDNDDQIVNFKICDLLIENLFTFATNRLSSDCDGDGGGEADDDAIRHLLAITLDRLSRRRDRRHCDTILSLGGWRLLLCDLAAYVPFDSPLLQTHNIDRVLRLSTSPSPSPPPSPLPLLDIDGGVGSGEMLLPLLKKLTRDVYNVETTKHMDHALAILDTWSQTDESVDPSDDDMRHIVHILSARHQSASSSSSSSSENTTADTLPADFHYHTLRALATMAAQRSNTDTIHASGGVRLIYDLYSHHRDDERMKVQAARALGNLARTPELVDAIVDCGFYQCLIAWSRQLTNIKLHLQANRALLNMRAALGIVNTDSTATNSTPPAVGEWYVDELYPFHVSHDPLYRDHRRHQIPLLNLPTVSFVHDLARWWIEPLLAFIRRDDRQQQHQLDGNTNSSSNNKQQQQQQRPLCVDLDVVFVHGLMGNPINTWRTLPLNHYTSPPLYRHPHSILWPKFWLPTDVRKHNNGDASTTTLVRRYRRRSSNNNNNNNNSHMIRRLRVLSVGYQSLLTDRDGTSRALPDKSAKALHDLLKAGVGSGSQRRTVFVAHSMGGLLVKHVLLDADISNQHILNSTVGIAFYGTPHFGSPVTGLTHYLGLLFPPSAEVYDLKADHPILVALNEQLKSYAHIKVISFGEGEEVSLSHLAGFLGKSFRELPLSGSAMLVPLASSNPGHGVFVPVMDKNHFDVGKPVSRDDIIYVHLVHFIRQAILAAAAAESSSSPSSSSSSSSENKMV